MTTDTEALPPLPKKRRAMLCTKCGFSGQTEAEASPRGAPCQRCDYTAFVQEIDYSDEEMLAYARAAFAQRQQVPEQLLIWARAYHPKLDEWDYGYEDARRYVRNCLEAALTAAPQAAQAQPIHCPACGYELK